KQPKRPHRFVIAEGAPVIPGRFFTNYSSGATGTIVGGAAGSVAPFGRPGAAAAGSPWAAGVPSLAVALLWSFGRVRGSGGNCGSDELRVTGPMLFQPGRMFGMSPGGTSGGP